jgi:hypothetical protein
MRSEPAFNHALQQSVGYAPAVDLPVHRSGKRSLGAFGAGDAQQDRDFRGSGEIGPCGDFSQ